MKKIKEFKKQLKGSESVQGLFKELKNSIVHTLVLLQNSILGNPGGELVPQANSKSHFHSLVVVELFLKIHK